MCYVFEESCLYFSICLFIIFGGTHEQPEAERFLHKELYLDNFLKYILVIYLLRIHSASELCQTKISRIIEHITGTNNSQDDIIVWASTKEELIKRTIAFLQSCRKNNLKLNKAKCQFNMREIIFLGHKISEHGI